MSWLGGVGLSESLSAKEMMRVLLMFDDQLWWLSFFCCIRLLYSSVSLISEIGFHTKEILPIQISKIQICVFKFWEFGLPQSLAGFKKLGAAVVPTVDLKTVAEFKALVPGTPDSTFVWVFTGTLTVVNPGKYTMCTSSDDWSNLYINNAQVVDNNGFHGNQERCGDRSCGRPVQGERCRLPRRLRCFYEGLIQGSGHWWRTEADAQLDVPQLGQVVERRRGLHGWRPRTLWCGLAVENLSGPQWHFKGAPVPGGIQEIWHDCGTDHRRVGHGHGHGHGHGKFIWLPKTSHFPPEVPANNCRPPSRTHSEWLRPPSEGHFRGSMWRLESACARRPLPGSKPLFRALQTLPSCGCLQARWQLSSPESTGFATGLMTGQTPT